MQRRVSQLPSHDLNFSLWADLTCKGVIPGRCHCIGQFAALLLLLICTFRTQDLLFQENSSWTPKAKHTSCVVPTDSRESELCSSLRQEDKGIVLLPSLIHLQRKGKRAVQAVLSQISTTDEENQKASIVDLTRD